MKKGEGKTQPTEKNKKQITFLLEEAIPKAQQERKKYVADCAFFYSTIFKSKLEHFIGEQLKELAYLGRDEEFYNTIRCNINCFRLIDEWFERKTNEHIGNVENIRNSFESDKDFISNIKKTYGKD
jgi:hypothetical protein